MENKIIVNLKDKRYPVYIDDNLMKRAGELIKSRIKNTEKIFIISDKNVFPLYGENLIKSLENSGFTVYKTLIEPGELSKTLSTASYFYDKLIDNNLNRNSTVIGLGGGVVGDLAGFIASTYMRGTNFVQIPTSLLAQVDSSVGGKVAVNHPLAKNIIGNFYQPNLVLSDVSTLSTLPENEFISGMGEVIKHGFGFDKNYFNYINSNQKAIMELNKEVLKNLVYGSCQIKKKIVEKDEKEQDIRKKLNLGHTIAHSLEKVTDYEKYSHGEAVAIGLIYETKLARKLNLVENDILDKLKNCLEKFSLPTYISDNIDIEKIIETVKYDKKATKGKVNFSLPTGIGSIMSISDWEKDDLRAILAE